MTTSGAQRVEPDVPVLAAADPLPPSPAARGLPAAAPSVAAEGICEIVVRRTAAGWRIDGEPACTDDSLLDAMTLADLLAADFPPPDRPQRCTDDLDENARLRLTVSQLEHALTARVVVEQAIGVLTERLRTSPRIAFERLRKAARSRGRRVHHLAREVVESASDRSVPLPPELLGPR
jgi:hypothetical protein